MRPAERGTEIPQVLRKQGASGGEVEGQRVQEKSTEEAR